MQGHSKEWVEGIMIAELTSLGRRRRAGRGDRSYPLLGIVSLAQGRGKGQRVGSPLQRKAEVTEDDEKITVKTIKGQYEIME
jgi:hypothetical protein